MLSINPSEVIWTILCFLALLFLLNQFLYKPLVRFMDERKARIDEGLDEESAVRAALEEDARGLEQEREETLQEARRELLAEKSRNEDRHAEAIRAAKQTAAESFEQGKSDADALRSQASHEMEQRRDELAERVARRLLDAGNLEQ